MSDDQIQQRKKDHVELTSTDGTQYAKTSGFERYEFTHNALPETDYNSVSTETELLGRTFSFPLFLSSMTGGYEGAGAINAIIAEFCGRFNLPFGVGSQRAMLEKPELSDTFAIVRKKAPDAFICANIGGAQLIGGLPQQQVDLLIKSIAADAVIVHLNPLQELMQPEGDRNFTGILDGIEKLASAVSLPVIAKETGAGISKSAADKLLDAGVSVIDVAGAGGTSWAKVENARKNNQNSHPLFNEWGISTVDCINDISQLRKNRNFNIIASGGIRSSFDIAKALCLGADFTAAAQPLIKAIIKNGTEGLEELFEAWKHDFKLILTLLGCQSPSELNKNHLRQRMAG